jgi:hypothetical protein
MISEIMAESMRQEPPVYQSRQRRSTEGRTVQSYHSDIPKDPEYRRPTLEFPYQNARPHEEYLMSRQPTTYHPSRRLFDHHNLEVDPPAVRAHRDSRESRYHYRDRVIVPASSRSGGSSLSQSDTHGSRWIGSPGTQWSSRSSHSTAPSSVQSISDERRRQEMTQHPTRHSSVPQYSGRAHDPPPDPQSYTDPRTGRRIGAAPRPVAQERPVAFSAMQPDDDPPDWDETPNFRELAGISRYGGTAQGSLPASHFYVDPITGQRIVSAARPAAQERPVPDSTMQPDDDPPDWDETPNFRGFAGSR